MASEKAASMIDEEQAALQADFLAELEATPTPGHGSGRGIVMCFGGLVMTANAYVSLRQLRTFCDLPVEIFYAGDELPESIKQGFSEEFEGVSFHDLTLLPEDLIPGRMAAESFRGWPIKAYALWCCSFQEVLLLDCDNFPVNDPSTLFSSSAFQQTGAVFWPDLEDARWTQDSVFEALGLEAGLNRAGPEFESGQMVLDKARCWKALSAVCLMNSDQFRPYFYSRMWGDKDTFRVGFLATQTPFHLTEWPTVAMGCPWVSQKVPFSKHFFHLPHPSGVFKGVGLVQHGPNGEPLFLHRTRHHWCPEMNFRLLKQLKPIGAEPVDAPWLGTYDELGFTFLNDFRQVYRHEFPPDMALWRVARLTEIGVRILDLWARLLRALGLSKEQ